MAGQSSQAPSSVEEHRGKTPMSVLCAVLTISDTRTPGTDRSGSLIVEYLESAGHRVRERHILPDEPDRIRASVNEYAREGQVQVVLLTGGTGISPRDQTYETISAMLTKPLLGYGELFRSLSYHEIGAAAMLSRAVGGLMGTMLVLTMPGSTAAVRLAMEKLILPELVHVVREATK
jgi:molybdenum cofactor biosynthesis protein B